MTDFFWTQIKKRQKIVKYIVAGGTATGMNLALLYIFTDWLGFWYLISAMLAFIGGFFTSFFLHKIWTFQDNSQERIKRQMTIFLSITLTNLAMNALLIYLLVDIFGLWYMLAQTIIAALIAFWNYNAFRIFVFKPAVVIQDFNE